MEYYIYIVKPDYSLILLTADNCHDAKSVAGMLFQHNEKVKAVYVYEGTFGGMTCFLRLVSGAPELTINIPSEKALVSGKSS